MMPKQKWIFIQETRADNSSFNLECDIINSIQEYNWNNMFDMFYELVNHVQNKQALLEQTYCSFYIHNQVYPVLTHSVLESQPPSSQRSTICLPM